MTRGRGITRASASWTFARSTSRCGHEIALREEDEVRRLEHHRVLERLVLALGDGEDDHVRRLPEVVDRRADEVPDVLDEEDVRSLPGEVVERAVDQLGVEVAGLPGRDRLRRDARLLEPARVVVGREIGRDGAEPPALRRAAPFAVASRTAVFPAPGEPMRFSASTPAATKCSRLCRAARSLPARIFSCSSTGTSSVSPQPQVVHIRAPPSRCRRG